MWPVVLVFSLMFLVCNCTRADHPPQDTFRSSIDSDPNSMDWQLDYNRVHENIAEGLTQYDLMSHPPVLRPALAKSWRPSQNGRIWTFTLRDDVSWSDGTKFKGEQVVASWKRLLSPQTGSKYAYHLFAIKNAKAFFEGRVGFDEVGIKLKDSYTLEIELSKPVAFFPATLTMPSLFPVRTDLIDRLGADWAKPGSMVSLGPYRLEDWQHDKKITLIRNDSYYGERPKIKTIDLSIINSKETQLTMFEAGKLDQVFNVPEQRAERYQGSPGFHLVTEASVTYLGLVVSKPPLDSALVRRALAHGIDRQGLGKILRLDPQPLGDWVPPVVPGHDEEVGLKYDPDTSKALLKRAGLTEPQTIEIALYRSDDMALVAEFLQAQLKKSLGWTVTISTQDFKLLRARLKDNPPNTYLHGWTADYLDPDTFFSILTSASGDNHTHFKDAKYDGYVEKASQTVNVAERLKLYHQAQKRLIEEEAAVIPLYVSKQAILSGPRVKTYPYNPLEKMIFKFAELE